MSVDILWWQKGIIYQVYPRSFRDSNGDGIGDLPGIISKLDYLASLGITAIWLSPIYPSPMKDFGYDVADYCAIHEDYGTLADFDQLLNEVHRRGLKLILDIVPNHTSDQHPWFIESRSSRDTARRDWYIWADPKPDGGPPNNWTSFFGTGAWTFDAHTGQCYLHQFLREQPELNWRNPKVRAAMCDVMRFWLERGVDGFRVDVIWLLAKDQALRDEPRNPDWMPGQLLHGRLLHTYTQDLPETHDYVREMRTILDNYTTLGRERMMVGEIFLPFDQLVAYYEGQCHLPFNFSLIGNEFSARLPLTASRLRTLVTDYEAALPACGWPNWVLGSHDQPRLATRFGMERKRLMWMLLLTLRGTPTWYYGDEIGMHNVPISLAQARDPAFLQQPDNPDACRDPARTPMQWNSEPFAGFSRAESWLPVADDVMRINVEAQEADPESDLNFFRALVRLRQAAPALTCGSIKLVDSGHDDVFAYVRSEGQSSYLVLLNFSDRPSIISRGLINGARSLISTHPVEQEVAELAPCQGRMYML